MGVELQTSSIEIETEGHTDIVDITQLAQQELQQTGFTEGHVTLFVVGSTGALTCVEYEPGLVKQDLPKLFDSLAPYGADYGHHQTWGDDNGASHVRASLVGSSLSVPFQQGKLLLGTWQQIIFLDFDTRPRARKIVAQFIGKA